MLTETEKMSFEDFKSKLRNQVGENGVYFREVGKDGWTHLDQLPERLTHGNAGPHWCDAEQINPRAQYLLGHYDFNSQTATFFVRATHQK